MPLTHNALQSWHPIYGSKSKTIGSCGVMDSPPAEAKRNSGAFLRQQTPPREAFPSTMLYELRGFDSGSVDFHHVNARSWYWYNLHHSKQTPLDLKQTMKANDCQSSNVEISMKYLGSRNVHFHDAFLRHNTKLISRCSWFVFRTFLPFLAGCTSFNATWSHLRCRQWGAADVAWRWW